MYTPFIHPPYHLLQLFTPNTPLTPSYSSYIHPVHVVGAPEEVAAWVDTTFTRALTSLVTLYAEGYGVLGHLLGDMLQVRYNGSI